MKINMDNLPVFISRVLRARTFRQSGVTLIGTFLNGAIGVIFYILVARLLGPKDYGVFSFVTVTVALLASIANVGTDTGITKFVAESWETNRPRSLRFLSAGLIIKLISFSLLLLGGALCADFIIQFVLHKSELKEPFYWALFGVGGSMLFSFGCSALQSLQKFWAWSFVNVFGNSLRLVVFLILIASGFNSIGSAVVVFVVAPFLGFLTSIFILPRFINHNPQKSEFVELFHFNKWVAATTVIVAISTRLDSLYSTRFLSLEEVGYYSVAISLVGFISQIVLALGSVAAPKFASFKEKAEAQAYLYKLEIFVFGLSLIGVPVGVLVAHFAIPIIYGSSYASSVAPLVVLIIAYAIFLISMPIHTMILYFYGNSKFFFWLSLFHIICIIPLAWLLIPKFGIMGAAYSVFVGMVIDFLIPVIFISRKMQ